MPNIKNMLHAEIDLAQPVPELCAVIAGVLAAWPGRELEVLIKLREAIDGHLQVLEKEAEKHAQQVRKLAGSR